MRNPLPLLSGTIGRRVSASSMPSGTSSSSHQPESAGAAMAMPMTKRRRESEPFSLLHPSAAGASMPSASFALRNSPSRFGTNPEGQQPKGKEVSMGEAAAIFPSCCSSNPALTQHSSDSGWSHTLGE
jgi:hypothetical protein